MAVLMCTDAGVGSVLEREILKSKKKNQRLWVVPGSAAVTL